MCPPLPLAQTGGVPGIRLLWSVRLAKFAGERYRDLLIDNDHWAKYVYAAVTQYELVWRFGVSAEYFRVVRGSYVSGPLYI